MQDRTPVFLQAYSQLTNVPASNLRRNDRAFKVTLKNERVEGEVGPYRETLSQLCSDLQSDTLPLLIACPNKQQAAETIGVGENRCVFSSFLSFLALFGSVLVMMMSLLLLFLFFITTITTTICFIIIYMYTYICMYVCISLYVYIYLFSIFVLNRFALLLTANFFTKQRQVYSAAVCSHTVGAVDVPLPRPPAWHCHPHSQPARPRPAQLLFQAAHAPAAAVARLAGGGLQHGPQSRKRCQNGELDVVRCILILRGIFYLSIIFLCSITIVLCFYFICFYYYYIRIIMSYYYCSLFLFYLSLIVLVLSSLLL